MRKDASVPDDALSKPESDRFHRARFTYNEVGSRRDAFPANTTTSAAFVRFEPDRAFRGGRTRPAVLGLAPQAGLLVRTASEQVVTGAVAVLRLGLDRLSVSAPVSVVYGIDEPRR